MPRSRQDEPTTGSHRIRPVSTPQPPQPDKPKDAQSRQRDTPHPTQRWELKR